VSYNVNPRLSTALRTWLLVSMVALVFCGLIGMSSGSTTVGLGFGVGVIGLFTVMTSSHYSSTLRSLGVKQVSRGTPVRSLGLVVALVSACSQPGGNGSGGSSATYSGADLAASLKQGAVQQGYAADKVTAICGTAPKRAGAVSDCTITRNGIANDIRVTYSDDQGHFTTETLR